MSSKIIGSDSEFFANMAVTAALNVKREKDGKFKCPIGNVHILKSHGKSCLVTLQYRSRRMVTRLTPACECFHITRAVSRVHLAIVSPHAVRGPSVREPSNPVLVCDAVSKVQAVTASLATVPRFAMQTGLTRAHRMRASGFLYSLNFQKRACWTPCSTKP